MKYQHDQLVLAIEPMNFVLSTSFLVLHDQCEILFGAILIHWCVWVCVGGGGGGWRGT